MASTWIQLSEKAQFVENDEVRAHPMIDETALASVPGFRITSSILRKRPPVLRYHDAIHNVDRPLDRLSNDAEACWDGVSFAGSTMPLLIVTNVFLPARARCEQDRPAPSGLFSMGNRVGYMREVIFRSDRKQVRVGSRQFDGNSDICCAGFLW